LPDNKQNQLQFGLLYTGSDDGLIYVSKDGGVSWNKPIYRKTMGFK
jgi:uncharacterized membrane protein